MRLPTLFHLGKAGALYQWVVETQGADITTTYGQVDGKMQVTTKKAKAKNVGRSNEVSPEDQAVKEARAMHKKKTDLKYSLTPDEAGQPVFLPMLAHKFEDCKKKIVYPVCVQPKLNGVRCLASREGRHIRLLSRGGKEYNVPQLKAEIDTFIESDEVIDGEIYIPGTTLQQVTRLVKKYRPRDQVPEGDFCTDDLELWVYDTFRTGCAEAPWASRRIDLELLSLRIKKAKHVYTLDSVTVSNEEDVYNWQRRFVSDGYEGAIVRVPDGTYELGHRSRKLLKVKSWLDNEYRITGYTNGVGRFADCVIWVCTTAENREFKVVPKGTLVDKRKWLADANKCVGKFLTVKYFELTEDLIPQFPVGMGIRDPEM